MSYWYEHVLIKGLNWSRAVLSWAPNLHGFYNRPVSGPDFSGQSSYFAEKKLTAIREWESNQDKIHIQLF